jgi:outer membrane receptor protein involved in Fe transport
VAAVVALLPEYELNPVGLTPPDGIWNSTRPENAQDADLKGFELAYQQPFSFLPGFWSNFGVIANYTYVDSEAEFGDTKSALPGLSKKSYNFTGWSRAEVFELLGPGTPPSATCWPWTP